MLLDTQFSFYASETKITKFEELYVYQLYGIYWKWLHMTIKKEKI